MFRIIPHLSSLWCEKGEEKTFHIQEENLGFMMVFCVCFFIDGFLIDWFFAAAGVDLLLASTRLSPSIQVSSVGDQQSNFNGDTQKKISAENYLFIFT